MHRLLIIFSASLVSPLFGDVDIPRSQSPEGNFIIKLSTDKDRPDYEPDTAPTVWIEDTRSGKRLAEFPFAADPNSDMQPLRSHTRILWSPSETAVAVTFRERFYSHLHVFRLDGSVGDPKGFIEGQLPRDSEIIQLLVPRFREFRSRWHQHADGWVDQNTLIYTTGSGALLEPSDSREDPNFYAGYRFTVDYEDPITPIIRRIEFTGDE